MTEKQDYMQSFLEDVGTFRCKPIEWTLEVKDSGAKCIAIRFYVMQKWHGKEGWSQEWLPGFHVIGRVWIVKKDGTLNAAAVDNLAKCGLWNGDPDKIAEAPPWVTVHVDVSQSTWEGKVSYRGDWVSPDADEPQERGGFAPADQSMLDDLRKTLGAQLKVHGGAGATKGAPPTPPAATMAAPQPAQEAAPATQAASAPEQAAPAAPAAPGPTGGFGGPAAPGQPQPDRMDLSDEKPPF